MLLSLMFINGQPICKNDQFQGNFVITEHVCSLCDGFDFLIYYHHNHLTFSFHFLVLVCLPCFSPLFYVQFLLICWPGLQCVEGAVRTRGMWVAVFVYVLV